MRAAPLHPHDEAPNPLTCGDASPARAGRFRDEDAGGLVRFTFDPFARGRAPYLLVRREQQHYRSPGLHLLLEDRTHCMKSEKAARLHIVDARAASLFAAHL